MSSLGAVANRELVLCRRNSQRPDHHRGQRIGELALEHRAFASDHTMMLGDFVKKKWRKDVGQTHLRRTLEISGSELEVLRHYAEGHVLLAENLANLA